MWCIIEWHDMPLPEGEKLTNKVMAMFLCKQKAQHQGLQIGKMCSSHEFIPSPLQHLTLRPHLIMMMMMTTTVRRIIKQTSTLPIATPTLITASSLPFTPLHRCQSRRFHLLPLWRTHSSTPPHQPLSWPSFLLFHCTWMHGHLLPLSSASGRGYGHESVGFLLFFAANQQSHPQNNRVPLRRPTPNYKMK